MHREITSPGKARMCEIVQTTYHFSRFWAQRTTTQNLFLKLRKSSDLLHKQNSFFFPEKATMTMHPKTFHK